MSSSVPNAQAKSITFTDDSFSVHLADGRILIVPLAYFPRLLNATAEQLKKYELSGGGTGSRVSKRLYFKRLNNAIH